jgi:hypothetical protein
MAKTRWQPFDNRTQKVSGKWPSKTGRTGIRSFTVIIHFWGLNFQARCPIPIGVNNSEWYQAPNVDFFINLSLLKFSSYTIVEGTYLSAVFCTIFLKTAHQSELQMLFLSLHWPYTQKTSHKLETKTLVVMESRQLVNVVFWQFYRYSKLWSVGNMINILHWHL